MRILSDTQIASHLRLIEATGLIDPEDNSLVVIDLDVLRDRVSRIQRAFGSNAFHAVAIKSNPLLFVLKDLVALDVGLEAASLGEVLLAVNAGIDPKRIVFDSPVKTHMELAYVLENCQGMRVNCDSLAELERLPKSTKAVSIGLRVNPNVSSTTHVSMNVGSKTSKFGESISNRELIVEKCCHWDALDCIHFHIGSQHQDFQPVVEACNKILDLAEEINAKVPGKIQSIDIGGGFPVNYSGDPLLIEDYAQRLREDCPRLFCGDYQIITEFGRYVHANTAFVASKVEYVKQHDQNKTAIIHVGADMFLRECYNPGNWSHRISVLDRQFVLKDTAVVTTDVAGPLCFGGDFVQRGVELPDVFPRDWLVIHDAGANSFSLWSRHCSRPFPKVIAIDSEVASIGKHRESLESVVKFWS